MMTVAIMSVVREHCTPPCLCSLSRTLRSSSVVDPRRPIVGACCALADDEYIMARANAPAAPLGRPTAARR